MDNQFSISLILVIANVGISFMAFSNPQLKSRFQFNPYAVAHKKEWWRFFTHGFVHADLMHLAFNMVALYSFGKAVESVYPFVFGDKAILYFLLLYFGGLLVAILPSYEKHRNDIFYNSVGASGAVSAVVFASIVYYPFSKILVFFVPMPAIVFAVLYMIYSFYAGRRGQDNINHSAHISGALFGLFFTAVANPSAYKVFLQQIQDYLQ